MAQLREDDDWLGWRVHSGIVSMTPVPCTHLGRRVGPASCSLVKRALKHHSEQGARNSAPPSALLRRGMRRPSSRALEAWRRDADPSRGASAVKSWRRRTRQILLANRNGHVATHTKFTTAPLGQRVYSFARDCQRYRVCD